MRHKALVFDFFGVICSEVAPFWLADHFPDSQGRQIKEAIVGPADRGDVSQDSMFEALSELTDVPAAQIEREWLAYARIDGRVVELIETLKPSCKIGLLTNSPAPFFRALVQANQLGHLFDAITVSSETRMAKPDPEIYRSILVQLGVAADEALLIDDNSANVHGAVAIGMDGIVFQSLEQLRSELYLQG